MVTLTEVEDEHFQHDQPGPDFEDDDDYSDTGTSQSLHLSLALFLSFCL